MENVFEKESGDKSPHSKIVDSLTAIANTVEQIQTSLATRKNDESTTPAFVAISSYLFLRGGFA
jgi:hypothetical protein